MHGDSNVTKENDDAADSPDDMLSALRRAERIRNHDPVQGSTLGGLEWLGRGHGRL